ncbi:MAG: hypothetical protein ACI8O8_003036, partial [Oleiphilaceae bacterium]
MRVLIQRAIPKAILFLESCSMNGIGKNDFH